MNDPHHWELWLHHGRITGAKELSDGHPYFQYDHRYMYCRKIHGKRWLAFICKPDAKRQLRLLLKCFELHPKLRKKAQKALLRLESIRVPLMPLPHSVDVLFSAIHLRALIDIPGHFHRNAWYPCRPYEFESTFENEKWTLTPSRQQADLFHCKTPGLVRQIRTGIEIRDETGRWIQFITSGSKGSSNHLRRLQAAFKIQDTKTIKETQKNAYRANLEALTHIETHIRTGDCPQFCFFAAQKDFLARIGCRPHAVIAAETGCGKTLMALSLIQMKLGVGKRFRGKALILSMKSTVVPGKDGRISQWMEETRRYCPEIPVHFLGHLDDVERFESPDHLPDGIYLSYYQGFFQRKACPLPSQSERNQPITVAEWLFKHQKPIFAWIGLDEAHLVKSQRSHLARNLRMLRATYRYMFTATPAAHRLEDMFMLMGWTNVPQWGDGRRQNPFWPYSVGSIESFKTRYQSSFEFAKQDRLEVLQGNADLVSRPEELGILQHSAMAVLRKSDCSPAYQAPKIDVLKLTLPEAWKDHYRSLLDGDLAGARSTGSIWNRMGYLRSLLAKLDASHQSPKLEHCVLKTAELVRCGQSVLILTSRLRQSDMLQALLQAYHPSGTITRLDSSVSSENQIKAAQLFQSGKAKIMIMGIKCATSHSFANCHHAIILSLEWSRATWLQAIGRIDRINSKQQAHIQCLIYDGTIEQWMLEVATSSVWQVGS